MDFDALPQTRRLATGMGLAVAKRTVFRDSDENSWAKVATRVAQGNLSLVDKEFHENDEYIRLRAAIASGALLTSGRHLQHGDRDQKSRSMELFTNCSTSTTSFLLFYLLLNGSGVGRSYDDALMIVDWANAPELSIVLSENHKDYPKTFEEAQNFLLSFMPDSWAVKNKPQDLLAEILLKKIPNSAKETVVHKVEDSREGWAKALEIYESMTFAKESTKLLVLDMSEIRPLGSPIAGMQDRPASGPLSLARGFLNIQQYVVPLSKQGKLRPWMQTMKVDHYIAQEVQVGGTRRAARMSVKDWQDPDILDFIVCKNDFGMWTSNNSIMVDAQFWSEAKIVGTKAQEIFEKATENSYIAGEPGFINGDKLEDYVKGYYKKKPVIAELKSKKYQVSFGLNLLKTTSLVCGGCEKACISGETEIYTNIGWKKAKDLIGEPFIAIVNGYEYVASGFWCNGTKKVYRIETEIGNSVKATWDHEIRTVDGWCPVSLLKVGSELVLPTDKAPISSTTKVVSITQAGEESVYDCNVPEVNCYNGNGLLLHNCNDSNLLIRTFRGQYAVISENSIVKLDSGERYNSEYEVFAKDLEIGDNLVLSDNSDMSYQEIDVENNIDFIKGWLLGELLGDGGLQTPNKTCRGYVRFWGDSSVYMSNLAQNYLNKLHTNYAQPVKTIVRDEKYKGKIITCASKKLTDLSEKYLDETKNIKKTIFSESDDFLRGFLRGFFDADGCVQGQSEKGYSARLAQINLHNLEIVQALLHKFGIFSALYRNRANAGYKELPDGKGNSKLYYCQKMYELSISGCHLDRFSSIVGFNEPAKADYLSIAISSRKAKKSRLISEIVSVEKTNRYNDNDYFFVKNNHYSGPLTRFPVIVNPCSELELSAVGGYCVIGDVAPLLACPVPFNSSEPGKFPDRVKRLWDSRILETLHLASRFLLRTNQMDSLYNDEVKRTQRIGVSLTGIHEWAWLRFGLSFYDLLDEKKSIEFWTFLKCMSDEAKISANLYALELGINAPLTVTTVKPAGTTAKLFNLTEGVHLPARRQYLRWVQFKGQKAKDGSWEPFSDPLLAEYEASGYPLKELKTFPGVTVVGFPTKPVIGKLGLGDKLVTAKQANPEDQYKWLELLEKYWLGDNQANQISYTNKVDVSIYSLDDYRKIVLENQPKVKCCSILPIKPDHLLGYEYLPEEEVTDEVYESCVSRISGHHTEEIDIETLICEGGACPL